MLPCVAVGGGAAGIWISGWCVVCYLPMYTYL